MKSVATCTYLKEINCQFVSTNMPFCASEVINASSSMRKMTDLSVHTTVGDSVVYVDNLTNP